MYRMNVYASLAYNEDHALEALKKLIKVDREWIPKQSGTSLYIRPFIIGTDPYLGISSSKRYQFIMIMCPVGSYYKEGIQPVKILVEQHYVRAVPGERVERKQQVTMLRALRDKK